MLLLFSFVQMDSVSSIKYTFPIVSYIREIIKNIYCIFGNRVKRKVIINIVEVQWWTVLDIRSCLILLSFCFSYFFFFFVGGGVLCCVNLFYVVLTCSVLCLFVLCLCCLFLIAIRSSNIYLRKIQIVYQSLFSLWSVFTNETCWKSENDI